MKTLPQTTFERSGLVEHAESLRGHPLLGQTALDHAKAWKFAALESPVELDITYKFVLRKADEGNFTLVSFDAPGEIRVESSPPIIDTEAASQKSQ